SFSYLSHISLFFSDLLSTIVSFTSSRSRVGMLTYWEFLVELLFLGHLRELSVLETSLMVVNLLKQFVVEFVVVVFAMETETEAEAILQGWEFLMGEWENEAEREIAAVVVAVFAVAIVEFRGWE